MQHYILIPIRFSLAALLCILNLKKNQSYNLVYYILYSYILFYPKLKVVGTLFMDKLYY